MPNILALECASDSCSVALLHHSSVVEKVSNTPKRHNALILPMIDELLSEAQLNIRDIDAYAFGRGPGSFTGIRIGASVVQGLAFANEKPVIPISSLTALAQAAYEKVACSEILTIVDARMGEVFWAHCKLDENKMMHVHGEECLCLPSQIPSIDVSQADLLAVGSGYVYHKEILSLNAQAISWLPDVCATAKNIAKLAETSFQTGELYPADQAIPVYLRETVNWKKLPGR